MSAEGFELFPCLEGSGGSRGKMNPYPSENGNQIFEISFKAVVRTNI